MRFIADGMLGKLTRWLRLAGQDVVYVGELDTSRKTEDQTLIERAKSGRRVLLTSDVDLYKRAKKTGAKCFLVRSNDVISQLAEISKFGGRRVEINLENSRCPLCNGELEEAAKEGVEGLIPENVFKSKDRFWVCTSCKKVYWKGKHWKTIIEMASKYNRMVESRGDA